MKKTIIEDVEIVIPKLYQNAVKKILFVRGYEKVIKTVYVGYIVTSNEEIRKLERLGFRKCVRGDLNMWLIKIPECCSGSLSKFRSIIKDEDFVELFSKLLKEKEYYRFGNLYMAE